MASEVVRIIFQQRGANTVVGGFRRIGRSARRASSGVRTLTAGLGAVGVVLGGRAIIDAADSFTTMENRIRLVTGSGAELNETFQTLAAVANNTRSPLDATTELFRRLSINTRNLGLEQDQVIGLIRTINQAVRVSGATAQEARNGLIQLAQGFASGQLRGEEFRAVAEQMPRILIGIADGLKLSIGALRELAFEGKVTPALVAKALASQAAKIDGEFAKLIPTIEEVGVVFNNNFTLFVGVLDDVFGGSETVRAAIGGLGQTMNDNVAPAAQGLAKAFAVILRVGADNLEILDELGATSINFGKSFALLGNAFLTFISSIRTGILTLVTGARAAGVALDFVTGALGFGEEAEFEENVRGLKKSIDGLTTSAFETSAQFDSLFESIDAFATSGDQSTKDRAAAWRQTADEVERSAAGVKKFFAEQTTEQNRLNEVRAAFEGFQTREELEKAKAKLTPEERAEEAAKTRIIALNDRLAVQEAGRVSKFDQQLEKLRQMGLELEKQVTISGNTAAADEARKRIAAEILEVEQDRADKTREVLDATTDMGTALEKLRGLSPGLAADFEASAEAALEGTTELAEQLRIVQAIKQEVDSERKALQQRADTLGNNIGRALGSGISKALNAALKGEAIDFGELLAETAAKLLGDALNNVLDELSKNLTATLSKSLGDAAGGGGLGNALGAGLGLALAIAAGALRDTDATVTNDLAVDTLDVQDVQQTRGVVVGPTNIPIFEVGRSIEEAFEGTNEILERGFAGVIEALGGSFGVPGEDPAIEDPGRLASTTSASLL